MITKSYLVYMRHLFISIFSICSICFSQFEKDLQLELILAQDGDTVLIEPGFFSMLGTISLENKNNLTIKGSGMSNTIISFNKQISGTEGIIIKNCQNIVFQDFSIQGYKQDAIVFDKVNGIELRELRIMLNQKKVEKKDQNSLSLKHCTNFIIQDCLFNSAINCGLLISESINGVVRFSEFMENSIGVKIVNSSLIDVHSNNIFDNAGGIALMSLPDLSISKSKKIRLFDNIIKNNNFKNRSKIENSSYLIPSGSGIFLLATENVEIFNNSIMDNKTYGVSILSYLITGLTTKDTEYSPYSSSIYIHDNILRGGNRIPELKNFVGRILFYKFFRNPPDIVYDGNINPSYLGKYDIQPDFRKVCIIDNNQASFINLNIKRNFTTWYKPFIVKYDTDINECFCIQRPLPQIEIN